MEIPRRKVLIFVPAALLLLVLVPASAGIAYLVLSSGDDLQYKTQAALRNALPATAAAELRSRGVTLTSPLTCRDLPGWTKHKMRASCTGTSTGKQDVLVLGSGEEKTGKAYYTILVDGRPVIQNTPCLGTDCQRQDS